MLSSCHDWIYSENRIVNILWQFSDITNLTAMICTFYKSWHRMLYGDICAEFIHSHHGACLPCLRCVKALRSPPFQAVLGASITMPGLAGFGSKGLKMYGLILQKWPNNLNKSYFDRFSECKPTIVVLLVASFCDTGISTNSMLVSLFRILLPFDVRGSPFFLTQ